MFSLLNDFLGGLRLKNIPVHKFQPRHSSAHGNVKQTLIHGVSLLRRSDFLVCFIMVFMKNLSEIDG